jgi:hypothetical protein
MTPTDPAYEQFWAAVENPPRAPMPASPRDAYEAYAAAAGE